MKLLVIFVFFGVSGQLWADNTLARVNGKNITEQDLIQYARQSPMLTSYLKTPGGPMRLLDNMIIEKLLLLEGERLGISRPPDNAGGDFGYAIKIKKELTDSCNPPDEEEKRLFYDSHPELFSTPLFLRMRRIGLKIDKENPNKTAIELEKIKQQIEDKKLTFKEAANNLSHDEIGRDRGGDIGFIRIDELNHPVYAEFAKADMKEIVGPIEEPGMLFLYQIIDRREPVLDPYNAVHAEVQTVQQEHCNQQALQSLVNKLKRRWSVKILIDDISIHPQQD